MLQWHVDVAGDMFAFGDRGDKLITPMGRMGVEKPHPKFSVNFFNLVQQSGQGWSACGINRLAWSRFFWPQIHPVVGRVLANQIDLPYALCYQHPDFGQDRFRRSAAMAPTHLRNDAETAWMIAAFRDLQIGGMCWRQAKTWRV